MRGYRSISIFLEHAGEMLPAPLPRRRDIRSNPTGFLAARWDKRARRERKPGRYANRENGRGRWISRISEGLMDIRILSTGGLLHVLPPFAVAFRPRRGVINALEKKLSTYLHRTCRRRILAAEGRVQCQPEILDHTRETCKSSGI